jgi:hypothetical protein
MITLSLKNVWANETSIKATKAGEALMPKPNKWRSDQPWLVTMPPQWRIPSAEYVMEQIALAYWPMGYLGHFAVGEHGVPPVPLGHNLSMVGEL